MTMTLVQRLGKTSKIYQRRTGRKPSTQEEKENAISRYNI